VKTAKAAIYVLTVANANTATAFVVMSKRIVANVVLNKNALLVYITPLSFANAMITASHAPQLNLTLVSTIDEDHCISQRIILFSSAATLCVLKKS
jgi:hypothetical protein